MDKRKKIMENLKEKWLLLKTKGYNPAIIFLQGSQNYDLDTKDSDIDAKAIVLPSLLDLVRGNTMISKTIRCEDNSLIDIKDVRIMIREWKKHNPTYLELLFTEYAYYDITFASEYAALLKMAHDIAKVDKSRTYKCMLGMMKQKRKSMTNPTEIRKEEVATYGYDRKDYSHLLRLYWMMVHMSWGKNFEETLKFSDAIKRDLMGAKMSKMDLDYVLKESDSAIKYAARIVDSYHEEDETEKEQIYEKLDKWGDKVILRSLGNNSFLQSQGKE